MSYRVLPPFERGIRVDAATAKQDRIDLEVGEWYFSGDDNELEFALLSLAEMTYSSEEGTAQRQYPLFQRPQGRSRHIRTLSFSSSRSARIGSPLISGQLRVQRLGGDDFSPSRYRLHFDLKINPTRALNHQPLHPEIRAGRAAATYPARPRLFRRRSIYRAGNEVALERNDNVILDRRQQAMSSPQHWIAYRNLYFQEVVRFLEQTLDQAFRQYGFTGSLNRAPRFNLKAVENYWEFRSDDPVRLIYDLEPSFRSLGTSSRFRLYSGVITDLITSGHVPTLNFRVVEGVTAKLYAKTTKRVRLETVHDLRSSHRVDTSHTRADIAGIVELLEQVVTHDAREANVALETLEAQLTPYEGRQSSPYEFVRLVMLSAPDEDTQQALLSIIVNARGIRCGPNDPFRPAVDQLVRWGFLERSRPNSLSYRVAEEFAGACELLRGAV